MKIANELNTLISKKNINIVNFKKGISTVS